MMRRAFTSLLAFGLVLSAAAYPAVSSGPVVLNQWNKNLTAALAKARELNRPAMVAVVDSSSCSYCKKWDAAILSMPEWPAFLAANPMVLIWVDRATLSTSEWVANTAAYRSPPNTGGISFPTVGIHHPNGAMGDKFLARDALGKNPGFYTRVGNTTRLYPYNPPAPTPGTIGFSAGTATRREDAGSVSIAVVRTGGSSDAQTFSYAISDGTAVAGVNYTATMSGNLMWGAGDANPKYIAVTLINDGQWTAPSNRTFTVTLAKTSGTAATGLLSTTVTITEVTPLTQGVVGFASATAAVSEGQAYTGSVARTAGTVGATTGTLSIVEAGYTLDVGPVVWTNGEAGPKAFVVSGIAQTPGYDPRAIHVTVEVTGSAQPGLTNLTVSVRDSLVTQTFEEYLAAHTGDAAYAPLTQAQGVWFYNGGDGALRSEPLGGGATAALSWTAPGAGRLTFKARYDAPTTVAPVSYEFQFTAGGETNDIGPVEATYSVLVNAGEVVRWIAESDLTGFYGLVKDLVWEPLSPVSGAGYSPSNAQKFQVDAVRADAGLVDLLWQGPGTNPADTQYRIYAGPSAGALALVDTVASPTGGVNAVDLGIVTTAEAQGWVYWRVDTVLTGATARVVSRTGPVWNFAVIDLPEFVAPTPSAGATVNAFLDAGAWIQIRAESATTVTYSAAGLPAGLSINAGSGLITGEPLLAGSYPVAVTARNSEGPVTVVFIIRVQALPSQSAVGIFNGFFHQGAERAVRGTLDLTTTSGGGLTARAVMNGITYTLRGVWMTGTPDGTFMAQLQHRVAGALTIQVDARGIMTGSFNGSSLLGRRLELARSAEFIGYYTSVLDVQEATPYSPSINNIPQGSGYVTFTVNGRSAVKYSGMLADGTTISGSSELAVYTGAELASLGYTGVVAGRTYACFPVYKALYMRRGLVAGQVWIDGSNVAVPADNRVFITGSSWIYPGRSPALTGDGFAASFDDVAFTEIGAYYMRPTNLALSFAGGQFQVAPGAVAVMASGTSIALPAGNALRASLRASSSTGLFSGTFYLPSPVVGRSASRVTYKGALVPLLSQGGGYYLESDGTAIGYGLKRSRAVVISR